MKKKLQGKNVLITGAATGIGKAIAMKFAEEGANIAINYNSSGKEAEETEEEINEICNLVKGFGCNNFTVKANLANEEEIKNMFGQIIDEWGKLDILINNSGIQTNAASHEGSTEDFDKVISINLRGAYICCREAIKHFLERGEGGVVLNNSSVHQIIPKPHYIGYSASKGGLGNLTRTLALEYAKHGIRVNAVAPGAIITPINKGWINDPQKKAIVESHIPMRRAGMPEEIASVFAFLASDEASYITGQTIYACGGLTLYPSFEESWSSD